MSLTTIKIDGQEVGLRFGHTSHRWFVLEAINDKDFFTGASDLTEIGVAKLLQFAYMNQCKVKEIKPDIPFEKFFDWVEDRLDGELSKELNDVLKVWADSQPVKKQAEEAEKKSQMEQQKSQNLQTSTQS